MKKLSIQTKSGQLTVSTDGVDCNNFSNPDAIICDGVEYLPVKKEFIPWRAEDDCKYLYMGVLGDDYEYDMRSEHENRLYSSGNYYNPADREQVEAWAKQDKFAALVRQYALGNGGGGKVEIASQFGIEYTVGAEYMIVDRSSFDSCIGYAYFDTAKEAEKCLKWVQQRMEAET